MNTNSSSTTNISTMLDVRGAVLADGRLHLVVDIHWMYPVRKGSALHEQITAWRRNAPALSNN